VRSAARFWANTPMSSAIDAENISVSTFPGKKMPVQNLTPIISVTIIAWLAWIICFIAEIAAGTEREEVVFPFSIISVKNVGKNSKRLACLRRNASCRQALCA
jgi:hypothetical protein